MARESRRTHVYAFAHEGDFNDQLVDALRKSPWWMVSIAVHVLIAGVLLMLNTSEAASEPPPQIRASMSDEVPLPPPDDDPPEHPDDIKDFETEDPEIIENADIVPEPSTDNDALEAGVLGNNEGISSAPLAGPSTSGEIGIGGGAGGGPFSGRPGNGDGTGGPRGGSPFDNQIEDALRWLAAHQSPNGGWEAAGFMNWCDGQPVAAGQGPDGAGRASYDVGVTGLSLCAFLGAGYTNRGNHKYSRVVSRGLRYLKSVQDPEGCFGPRGTQQYIYSHATAALAMVEAYGMTGSTIFKGSAQRALDFIALTRNSYLVWRYGIKPGDNDTSVTGWMMMALKSARLVNEDATRRGRSAPFVIDESAFDGIRAWLDRVTDPDTGRVGYLQRGTGPARPAELVDTFPADKSESMTAVGILARTFIGEDPRKSKVIQRGAALCERLLPRWDTADGSIDMYYWYYATLGMYQVGGRSWDRWRGAMKSAMADTQRTDGDFCLYKGSWDPVGPWGPDGGRVYSTAVMALCLQVYYRYDRVAGTK